MATADPAPLASTAKSIILDARRGDRAVSILIHYDAIQELRARLKSPHESAFGLLFGEYREDSASIEHCSATAGAQAPIGVFRTQPAGWPAITEPDCKRIQASLPATAPGALFLIVRTLEQRPWSATLFTVDPKRPSMDEAPLLEFPFDEYLLRNGWLTELAPPAPPPGVAGRTRPRRRLPWIATAAAAALIGGGAAAYELHWIIPLRPAAEIPDVPAVPAPVVSPIALKATRIMDEFEISWNRSAAVVRAATSGTLTIRNGPVTRMVPVSAEQLRDGRIMYHPAPGVDCNFRMELLMPDGNTEAESVQVVAFNTAPSLMLPVTAESDRARSPRQMAGRTDRAGVARLPASTSAPRTEPAPVRRVNPSLSRDVLNEMRNAVGKVTVSVLVAIDAAGTVGSAKVVSSTGEPSPSGPYIRLASLTAARQWKFRPATAGGRAVPSELTLVFNF